MASASVRDFVVLNLLLLCQLCVGVLCLLASDTLRSKVDVLFCCCIVYCCFYCFVVFVFVLVL